MNLTCKTIFSIIFFACFFNLAGQTASFTPYQIYRIQNSNGYADLGSANVPVTITTIDPFTGTPHTITSYPVGPLPFYQFRTSFLGFLFEKNIVSDLGKFSSGTGEITFNFLNYGSSPAHPAPPVPVPAMFITKTDGKVGIGHTAATTITGKLDILSTSNKINLISTANFTLDNLIANSFRVNRDKTKAISVSSTNYFGSGATKETFIVMGNGATHIGEKLSAGVYKDALLSVYGQVVARSFHVTIDPSSWADYVFDKQYSLLPLPDLEKFYLLNRHLPEIPAADELGEKGMDVADMEKMLLQKIEELTLYVVQQNKEIEKLKLQIDVITKH